MFLCGSTTVGTRKQSHYLKALIGPSQSSGRDWLPVFNASLRWHKPYYAAFPASHAVGRIPKPNPRFLDGIFDLLKLCRIDVHIATVARGQPTWGSPRWGLERSRARKEQNSLHQTDMRPKSLLPLRKPRLGLGPDLVFPLDTARPSNSRDIFCAVKAALDVASPVVDVLRLDTFEAHRHFRRGREWDAVQPFLRLVAVGAGVDAGGQGQVWGEARRARRLIREVGREGRLDELGDDCMQGMSGWWGQPK